MTGRPDADRSATDTACRRDRRAHRPAGMIRLEWPGWNGPAGISGGQVASLERPAGSCT